LRKGRGGQHNFRDISAVLKVSIAAVLQVFKSTKYKIKPKQNQNSSISRRSYWIYVDKKQNKVRLIYAYHRDTGEIAAWNFWFAEPEVRCVGETRPENGVETEKTDKTAGNNQ
jgi:hypothetical protein